MVTSQTTLEGADRTRNAAIVALGMSLGVYLLWCAATYWFEGRLGLTLHPTVRGRMSYTIVANTVIGIVVAALAIRAVMQLGLTSLTQLGFRSARRTALAVVLAAVAGAALFIQAVPDARDPLVILNAFKNLVVTSIAELLVCWVLIGGTVEALLRPRGRMLATIGATLVATLLFAVYHYAHSAPFNQLPLVLLMLMPGLVVSLIYFLGRDLYATVIAQNFLAMIGLWQNGDPAFQSELHLPLYLVALGAIVTLVAADLLIIRRGANRL